MDLTQLRDILSLHSPQYLEHNKYIISDELTRLQIPSKDQTDLIKKILKIAKISKNPKTRESYLQSYFRVYRQGIEKDGRDSSIIIEITKKCPKHCPHCYSHCDSERLEMADDILDSIIQFARKHVKHIFLTGGEPTLDPRVFSLAEKNPDIMFFLFTNGCTMTADYAHRLSIAGNIVPILSIDGNSPETHDRLRGEGSYDEICNAIDALNKYEVPWGYISVVTETNAHEVLSQEFVNDKIKKGAFLARYLEYLPVGDKPIPNLILSGETYFFMEKRKKEIMNLGTIYIQNTSQSKCTGLVYFEVNGRIKNCFCFHYARYNVCDGDIKKSIQKTCKEWSSYTWKGECPIYSDPVGFKNHLEKKGWKKIFSFEEEYLVNPQIAEQMKRSYQRFLELKAEQNS